MSSCDLYCIIGRNHEVTELSSVRDELKLTDDEALTFMSRYRRYAEHVVRQETVNNCFISTIFLWLKHGLREGYLFETMVLAQQNEEVLTWNQHDGNLYATYEDADVGHERMVEKYKDGLPYEIIYGIKAMKSTEDM